MNFKLALIQMRVEGGNKRANLKHAQDLIAEAATNGAAMALLPEAMDLGWTHPSSQTEAESIPDGSTCLQLSQWAAAYNLFLCTGITEADGNRIYNSAVIIDSQGNVLCKHRKLNELEIAHPYYAQGDRLQVVETQIGNLGLMICADGFANDCVISRSLGYQGADIILSPCAWAVVHDHDNEATPYGDLWRSVYKPVAKEFGLWIVGASNVGPIDAGPWAGRKCIGCSLLIDPDGNEVLQGPYDRESILYAHIDLNARPTRGCGWADHS
ncbi:MAG: carbon-nitrogen hydrolase family protein [Pirellulales bacterium]